MNETFVIDTNKCPFPYGTKSRCVKCWYNGPKYDRRYDIVNFMINYLSDDNYYDVFMKIKELYLKNNPNKEQEAIKYTRQWITIYHKLYVKCMNPIDEDGQPYFMSSCVASGGGGP